MNLTSLSFIMYFVVLMVVMCILQLLRKLKENVKIIQLLLLLIFSYYFIIKSDWRFFICVLFVTLVTYLIGILLDNAHDVRILATGAVVLLAFLGYFKYADFFVNSFRAVAGLDPVTLNIILPIGISFYIFSALSYIMDVYRCEYNAERNVINFALYIVFFPKLISGPIVRGKDFFNQVRVYRGVKWREFLVGIQIFVFGLFKKLVLANHLGVFVDDVYKAPMAYNTGTIILAVISYSLQIYFDFSGYSDMAIGVSKVLGFDFKPNFNLPYISRNVSEFWTRWHISLSSWFKDYLYIPLGGSRKGKVRTYINLLVVMLVSGLWHGAGWTYVMWGGLHGIASCINKAFGRRLKKLGNLVNMVVTYIIVTILWVAFRARDFSNAIQILKGMFTIHSGIAQPYVWSFFAIGIYIIALIVAMIHSRKEHSDGINGFYPVLDLSKFWSLVIFFTFCGLTVMLGYFGNTAFIYGAF